MESLLELPVDEHIDRCVASDGGHFDVAVVAYSMYKDRFKYDNKTWLVYSIELNEWIQSNISELDLRVLLSTEVIFKFIERSTHWGYQAIRAQDEDRRTTFENRKDKLLTISTMLKNNTYKTYLINECKCLFR